MRCERLLTWVCATFIFLPGAAFAQTLAELDKQGNTYFEECVAFGEMDACEAGIAIFSKILELDPDQSDNSDDAFYGRGSMYFELGNYAQAIADYTRSIKLQPDKTGVYRDRAEAYEKTGNRQAAIQDYRKILMINPDAVHDADLARKKLKAFGVKP